MSVRMYLVSSPTMPSDRQASAHAVHAWAQATHSSMQRVSLSRLSLPS
jgi:hypothetical protein